MKTHPLLLLFLMELCYCFVRNYFLAHYQGDAISTELWFTAIRTVSLVAVFFVFRKYILSIPKNKHTTRSRWLIYLSICVFMLIPICVGNWGLAYPANIVYAITSIVVGLREEFVYRAVLQQILQDKLGLVGALIISNIFFTVFHYGVWPITLWSSCYFFIAGSILGLIYYQTGNIWTVAFLHALFDAIYALTPLLDSPLPYWIEAVLLIVAIVFLIVNMKPAIFRQKT